MGGNLIKVLPAWVTEKPGMKVCIHGHEEICWHIYGDKWTKLTVGHSSNPILERVTSSWSTTAFMVSSSPGQRGFHYVPFVYFRWWAFSWMNWRWSSPTGKSRSSTSVPTSEPKRLGFLLFSNAWQISLCIVFCLVYRSLRVLPPLAPASKLKDLEAERCDLETLPDNLFSVRSVNQFPAFSAIFLRLVTDERLFWRPRNASSQKVHWHI